MQAALNTPPRASTMLRASYTISSPTLMRFNTVVPAGERSRVIETYMQRALEDKEQALEALAHTYLNDPAFAQCRSDEVLWEVTVADGLESTEPATAVQ